MQTTLDLLVNNKLNQKTYGFALIVTGSRNFTDAKKFEAVASTAKPDIIVVGDCKGTDQLAIAYATKKGIPVRVFTAAWNKFGKAAGPIRNQEMINWALLNCRLHSSAAFLAKDSVGTRDCMKKLEAAGVPIGVVNV